MLPDLNGMVAGTEERLGPPAPAGSGKGLKLEGPALDVPLENLTWRVLVPEGWRLAGHEGDLDLKEETLAGSFRLEDYKSFVRRKKQSDAKEAVALLDQDVPEDITDAEIYNSRTKTNPYAA